MYHIHAHMAQPSEDTKLWRYMDFSRFLALLETESLHMAALQSFEDPFEGHPPKPVVDALAEQPQGLSPEQLIERKEIARYNLGFFKSSRNLLYASCWHMNDKESVAMWSQYIRAGEGIAIQTTFEKLKASIARDSTEVTGGVVQYVDFETYSPEEFNVAVWGVLKRIEFDHEREFRLLALMGNNPLGFPIGCDPKILIEKIYVSPTTPDWVLSLVGAVLKRYEIAIEPIRSDLGEGPKYFEPPKWMQ